MDTFSNYEMGKRQIEPETQVNCLTYPCVVDGVYYDENGKARFPINKRTGLPQPPIVYNNTTGTGAGIDEIDKLMRRLLGLDKQPTSPTSPTSPANESPLSGLLNNRLLLLGGLAVVAFGAYSMFSPMNPKSREVVSTTKY